MFLTLSIEYGQHPPPSRFSSDPFEGLSEEMVDPPEDANAVACHCVREAFVRWQPHAFRTAKWLFGLAFGLVAGVITGVVEDHDALWMGCLGVVGLLVVLSAVSSVFAYRHETSDKQTQNDQQEPPPVASIA